MINSYNEDSVPLLDFEREGYIDQPAKKKGLKPWKRNVIILASVVAFLGIAAAVSWVFVVPRVANNMANQVEIEFTQLTITDPTQNSIFLITRARLLNPSIFDATASDVNCTVWFDNQPFLTIALPDLVLPSKNAADVVMNGTAYVLNQTTFIEFNKALTRSDNVTTTLHMTSHVRALGITIGPIIIEKDVTVPGFSGLKNTTVSDMDMSHSTAEEIIIYSTMTSYNPTYLTIDPLGDLFFELYFEGQLMGPVVVSNVSLLPGLNVMSSRTVFKPENLTAAGILVSKYFAAELIDVTVVGAANASSIPLFSAAFSGFAIQNQIRGKTTELVKEFAITSLALITTPDSDNSLTLQTDARVALFNPLSPEATILMQYMILRDGKIMFEQQLAGLFESYPEKIYVSEVAPLEYEAHLNGTLTVASSFDNFVASFLTADVVSFSLVGKTDALTTLVIGNVTVTGVPLDQTTSVKGLNGLKNTTIGDLDMSHSTAEEIILYAPMTIDNPTPMTINTLGNLSFDMYFEGQYMGPVLVSNVSLTPGPNVMSSKTVFKPENLTAAGILVSKYFAAELIDVTVVGAANASSIPLFSPALTGFAMSNQIRGKTTELVKEFAITSLALITTPDSDNSLTLQTDARVALFNPLSPEATMTMQYMILRDGKIMFEQQLAGLFENYPEKIYVNEVAPLEYEAHLNGTLTVDSAFDNFVTSFLTDDAVSFSLVGKTDAMTTLVVGNITVTGVPLNQNTSVKGLRGLKNCMNIEDVVISGGFSNGIYLTLHLTINNPSNAVLSLGRVSLDLFYQGVLMGYGNIPNFAIQPGLNQHLLVNSGFIESKTNPQLSRQFLSRYIAGDTLNVTLTGSQNATDYPFLQSGFSSFTAALSIPPLRTTLITSALLHLDIPLFFKSKLIPTQLNVTNPFETEIMIVGANMNVIYKQEKIAVLNADFLAANISIVMPPLARITTPKLPVKAVTLDLPFSALWQTVYLDVVGELTLYVGPSDKSGYTATIDFAQYQVPATVAPLFLEA